MSIRQGRSAIRALAVLRALNDLGSCTALGLSRETAIPRPAVYRVLDALCASGYVQRHPTDERYRVTHLVRRLSDGYRDEDWVAEIGGPEINKLRQQVVWPTDLATFANDAMYLRETSRLYSPFKIDTSTVGERLPMLITSAGRAYLAFCPKAEREVILANLARSSDPDDLGARDPRYVARIIRQTLSKGYAWRDGEFMPKTASISVPIMCGERVLATIAITFISSATRPAAVAARHLGALRETAKAIEQRVERRETGQRRM